MFQRQSVRYQSIKYQSTRHQSLRRQYIKCQSIRNLCAKSARVLGIFLVTALAGTASVIAAGSVSGTVLDARSGLPVRGATLEFSGTDVTAQADVNGVFTARIESGSFSVLVKARGYKEQRVTEVQVGDNATKSFSVLLEPVAGARDGVVDRGALVDEITVEARADNATEAALLAERRSASQIIDNIGAEEISKDTGSDAAGALKRVTGISLQDNKYVFVRGLGERYSNTTVNGSRVPTVEFDKKVVPLDLFAADLLEKVTVTKSYSVDQPGDFVAGVVELETKNFPAQQKISIGVSAGENSATTGERTLGYPRGLSFSGGGGQSLPQGVPADRLKRYSFFSGDGYTAEELEQFGELFIGQWTPAVDSSAPFDQGLKLSYGTSIERVGLVLGGTWSKDTDNRQEQRNFYSVGSQGLRARDSFEIDYGEESVQRSLMGNLAVRLGSNSQVSLRALDTSLAKGEGRDQTGFLADAIADIDNKVLRYQDQAVNSYQLAGDHFFSGLGGQGSLLEWKGAVSTADIAENRREVLYEIVDGEAFLSDLSNSGFLYFNDQADDLSDGRVDWSTMFSGSKTFGAVKAGLAYTDSERAFDGRRFRFLPRFVSGIDLTVAPEEVYTPENIGRGFELREVTNATDGYSGTSQVAAGYAQLDLNRGPWRFIGGLRFEDWDQEVITLSRTASDNEPTITQINEGDLLPSLSVVYAVGQNMALRGSLSRTVNRPDFRELAPFQFTQVLGGFNVIGNPDLVRAEIDSYDLRWEWFPSGGEVIAASVFYKTFSDPIEAVVISAVQDTQTFQNNDSATNRGFELEMRKRLGFLQGSLNSVTAILNYTWVDSEIQVDPASTILTNPKRPLTGQPDNVVNFVLEWAPPRLDSSTVRVLYNFVDDKVFLGGVRGIPDVTEDATSTVDLALRHGFNSGFSLKLTATNLLDEERRWSQGGELFRSYKPGRGVGLSVGYSF